MRRMFGTVLCLGLLSAVPAAAQPANEFHWSGAVARGRTLEIKGVNGEIRAELASGPQAEVVAFKRGRRSDPATVTVQVLQDDGNVTICAVYPEPGGRRRDDGERNACLPGDRGHMDTNRNDVVVDFVVKVPEGVRFAGKTVNGSIDAQGLRGESRVRTVNGRIGLSTSGVGSAQTVNGDIVAAIGAADWTDGLIFKTVNGSITLSMPRETDTNVRARMLNGRFTSAFPLSVTQFGGRKQRVEGTIGRGGRDLELTTVNGSVDLRFVTRE